MVFLVKLADVLAVRVNLSFLTWETGIMELLRFWMEVRVRRLPHRE